ncbi:LysR family transcriptional regulator [Gordonia polyisoprenivorans]|uniref:LysR family transcriptional regulator n=1 Tax=Gordonia polyisoprenivorans TaxID=84595 RepID=UPI001AD6C2CC|nr:LysR family transcriptional regulator [Gordonia polyisoprenivorans]QTI68626.1 LysR family transcriptional regulator [Gordonia polyisoprenivorans]
MTVVDLNLRQVGYLIAVVDEGHLGRAAERLFISPPALSQQIRKLERHLGTELLDRSAHPLCPTAVGERFLVEARLAIAASARAIDAVSAQPHRLRLGFMTAAIGPATREFLRGLRTAYPESDIELVELAWPEQATAVRRGVVDASLMRPPVADPTGLRFDTLCHERRVAAISIDHPLAHRESVTIDELDGLSHVTDDEADAEWVRWWACDPRPSGRPVTYGPSVHTISELMEVVATGEAISITGELVPDAHRHPGVAFIPVADTEPSTLCLCTRADDVSPMVRAARAAADQFSKTVRSAGATPR